MRENVDFFVLRQHCFEALLQLLFRGLGVLSYNFPLCLRDVGVELDVLHVYHIVDFDYSLADREEARDGLEYERGVVEQLAFREPPDQSNCLHEHRLT